jgi:hypothetical protein
MKAIVANSDAAKALKDKIDITVIMANMGTRESLIY